MRALSHAAGTLSPPKYPQAVDGDHPPPPVVATMATVAQIPDALQAIARSQDGLVTRQQALACGMSSNQVDRLGQRSGRGARVMRGVMALTVGELSRRQQIRAVLLYAGDGAVLTGLTALELESFRYAPADSRVHVLLPVRRQAALQPVMVLTRTTRMPAVRTRNGLPVAAVHRAVVDASRRMTRDREVLAVFAEAVQRGFCTLDMVADELESGPTAGSARARRAVRTLARGPASAPENDLLDLLESSEVLGQPQVNHPIVVDGRRFVADACWPEVRLVVEGDSVEHHGLGVDAEATAARRSTLTAAGWTVLSISPRRIRDDPAAVLHEIEAAYLLNVARLAG